MNPQNITYWQNRPITDEHRDWKETKKNWVEDYWNSWKHPHRKAIIEELKKLPQFSTLLEVGCNCGPNLSNIKIAFDRVKLFGIDASQIAVDFAKEKLPVDDIQCGDMAILPWFDKSMDVVLSDAALMYIHPNQIQAVMRELLRVARSHIVLVERQAQESTLTAAVWAHNFEQILRDNGVTVEKRKLTPEEWPESHNWKEYGHIIIGKL